MKRYISWLLVLILAIGMLSGCGGNAAESAAKAEKVVEVVSEIADAVLAESEKAKAESKSNGETTQTETEAPANDGEEAAESVISAEIPEDAKDVSALPQEDADIHSSAGDEDTSVEAEPTLDESGSYDSKEDVALYIHLYGKLPSNYITKKQAESLGWSGGSLEKYAPGKCIGGSYFGNYEGHLPKAKGREYHECDIDTLGAKSRGAKRIVFSNDGLIYYTDDHYNSFELLYGEE